MGYKITDGIAEAVIDSHGAELKSLKFLKNNEEFMWNADPEFWGRTSPVLFPIVGGLKDGKYSYHGITYEMGQHGFARDNKFEVISKEENRVVFLLESNEETLKKYPFEFKLYLEYSLKNGCLSIEYRVENLSHEEIYFSVGAHPAFSIPTDRDTKISDYYLEFEKNETASILPLEGRNISRNTIKFLENSKKIELSEDLFKDDAFIFKGLNSKKVSLKCKKNTRVVTMDYSNFEYIAFWNKVGAEFVCLEPWNGIADFVDASGRLEEKDGIIKLEGHGEYRASLKIRVKG
ncbi:MULTISPECIES: aldose 1-epimerase family protein [Psychrilyobacter]|uniref:Aldose 1-epimerase family protein n=1 Tax=Psychrilyobacter piezotolerans TaxID=2293438 RepID=A0ABX9KGX1_9FUSO|nr:MULTISPECIES: aldose 1-epimerase family protein [Psychrilyobacter]MCS5422459.1 aldose 1-epimerase family protein [Psychrilyobacter sp. S5]NDI78357.1 aldose 1-epimerase family protein [Psychrilyobacter piezotolerans]RDE61086.1 aldose 1-epimerase family protein [Psychrilyobacter sp. S5]REI40727.1 aldose 1-epimerase family protein [Psychrilyobacter piezotolerans]